MSDLPVIDVSELFGDPPGDMADRAIGRALAAAGGFVITGFPGAEELDQRAARLLQFFNLPRKDWISAATYPTNPQAKGIYRGFTSLLGGDDFARTEWFDIGPAQPIAGFPVRGAEILAERNKWPSAEPYPGWRTDMQAHYADLQVTAIAVMLATGRARGVDTCALERGFEQENSTLRLLHYPAPEASPETGAGISLAAQAHTDGSGLSLLWQAGPGLQVEGPDGVWRDVPQLPGSISVHLGDVLSMMTGGDIPATPHRVVDHGGERQSIGFFLEPTPFASMTGGNRLEDTYGWRLLQRLRSYSGMRELVPEPAPLQSVSLGPA